MSREEELLRSAKLPTAQHVIQSTAAQALKTAETNERVHMAVPTPSSSRTKPSEGATARQRAASAKKVRAKTGTMERAARNLEATRLERRYSQR